MSAIDSLSIVVQPRSRSRSPTRGRSPSRSAQSDPPEAARPGLTQSGSVLVGNPAPKSLHLNIQSGHSLKSADSNGLSDPYCLVFLQSANNPKKVKGKLVARTPIHYETLDPVWNFRFMVPLVFSVDTLRFQVWDYDMSKSDDFLGEYVLPLDCVFASPTAVRPLVLQPRPHKKDSNISGFIQVGFELGDPIHSDHVRVCKQSLVGSKVFTAYSLSGPSSSPSSSSSSSSSSVESPPASPSKRTPHRNQTVQEVSDEEVVPPHAFSLRLTLHSASNLHQDDQTSTDPYAIVALITPGNPPLKTEVARSHIVFKSISPKYELACAVPKVLSNQIIDIELRSHHQSSRDKFIGHCALRFPAVPPVAAMDQVPLALFPRSGRAKADKKVSGHVTLSYRAGAATEQALEHQGSLEAIDYEAAIPSIDLHRRNYGVRVANFRDIGGWPVQFTDHVTGLVLTGRIKERMIFRTSAINRATEHDSHLIIQELGIKTLFDLRTPDYAGNRGPFLTPFFSVREPVAKGGSTRWRNSSQAVVINDEDFSNTIKQSESQLQELNSEKKQEIAAAQILKGATFDYDTESASSTLAQVEWGHLYLQGLVGARFRRSMIAKSKKRSLVKAGLASTPQLQRRAICGPIFDPPDGITILYLMIVEDCKFEINRLMHSFLDVAVYPLAYFCNHGKDRTGLTTVFLHSVCGVDRETIINDYQLSDYFLRPIKDIVDAEMTDGGLLPQVMSRTPARALRSTLLFLDQKYGGVPEYLNHIGFDFEKQAELRNLLVELSVDTSPDSLARISKSVLSQIKDECLITIHSAQGLLDDQTHKASPFVLIKRTSELVSVRSSFGILILGKTPVLQEQMQPCWNHELIASKIDAATQFVFEIWDESSHDCCLGVASFSIDFQDPWKNHDHLQLELRPRSVGDRVSGFLTISIRF